MKRHFTKKDRNNPVKIKGLKQEVKNGNVERALKKLRKRVEEDGKLKLVREKEQYMKPSEKKRLAKKRAILRHRKELQKEREDLENGRLL